MRDHTTLLAFQEADKLAIIVYRSTNEMPRHERDGLTGQLRRAAISVPSNIVEGCARRTDAEFLQFLNIAFGSLRELRYQASLANRLRYMGDETFSQVELACANCSRRLAPLIKSMSSRSRKS